MARLEDLKQNFLAMNEAERFQFMESYVERRYRDITVVTIKVTKRTGKKVEGGNSKERRVAVTPDQLAQLRKLGLIS